MKTEVPKELAEKVLKLIEDVRASGKIKKGTNEATKSVERAEAQLVVIASDVNPPEIIAHLPMLCEEKKIPCISVPAKADLGAAAGLPVGTSAVAIVHPGEAAKKLDTIIKQIKTLTEKKAPKAETKKSAEKKPKEEKKPEPKKEKAPKPVEKKVEEKKPEVKKEEPKVEEKKEEEKPAEKPKEEPAVKKE